MCEVAVLGLKWRVRLSRASERVQVCAARDLQPGTWRVGDNFKGRQGGRRGLAKLLPGIPAVPHRAVCVGAVCAVQVRGPAGAPGCGHCGAVGLPRRHGVQHRGVPGAWGDGGRQRGGEGRRGLLS